MKIEQIREKPDADLREELDALRKEIFDRRFKSGQEETDERGKSKKLRREAARILTVLRERELGLRGGATGAGAKER